LGKRWRGQAVTVCSGTHCIHVKLTDWCACPSRNRLIDLDARSFADLAPLSTGVIPVTVMFGESDQVIGDPLPTAPRTDTD
jgi:hypothetical protein